jgi:hypothetical protein
MDLNNTLLLVLAGLLVLTVSSALVIARTAKSKGYSYGLFFFLAVVSYLLTAMVTVFIKPKGDKTARPRLSSLALLVAGVVVEFIGIGSIPESVIPTTDDDAALIAMFSDSQFLGGVAIAFAGILIVLGAVANEFRHAAKEDVRQL